MIDDAQTRRKPATSTRRTARPGPLAFIPAAFDDFDEQIDEWWQRLRGTPAVDRVFYMASEVGDFGLVWLTIGAAQAALGPAAKTPVFLRLAGALAFESVVVNGGIKSLFRRERPEWGQHRPLSLRRPRTSSFPSGHASSAVTAAILLTDRATPLAPVYWALAAVVATSRVHVKIHHASDVIGGIAVGVAVGAAIRRFVPLP